MFEAATIETSKSCNHRSCFATIYIYIHSNYLQLKPFRVFSLGSHHHFHRVDNGRLLRRLHMDLAKFMTTIWQGFKLKPQPLEERLCEAKKRSAFGTLSV